MRNIKADSQACTQKQFHKFHHIRGGPIPLMIRDNADLCAEEFLMDGFVGNRDDFDQDNPYPPPAPPGPSPRERRYHAFPSNAIRGFRSGDRCAYMSRDAADHPASRCMKPIDEPGRRIR